MSSPTSSYLPESPISEVSYKGLLFQLWILGVLVLTHGRRKSTEGLLTQGHQLCLPDSVSVSSVEVGDREVGWGGLGPR